MPYSPDWSRWFEETKLRGWRGKFAGRIKVNEKLLSPLSSDNIIFQTKWEEIEEENRDEDKATFDMQ